MTPKKFLVSVADAYAYDKDDNLLFSAKTLIESSIEASLGSQPVRAGRGNKLQYVYYHTAEMKVTLTESQWNLGMLGATIGQNTAGGYNYYTEETVDMTGSSGSVEETPLSYDGTTVYGWATSPSGKTERVVFSGKNFNVANQEEGKWCVRYYTKNNTSGQGITIGANFIPKVVKVVLEAQLNSADTTSNKIGIVQIIIPRVQLSGAFTISMTADGIANTPLEGTALAYTNSAAVGCSGAEEIYATITEILDNTNWYDNIIALAIEGGDFNISGATSPKTLSVWAIPEQGGSFKVANNQLTFTSSTPATATVGANSGVVTHVAAGTSDIKAVITAKPEIEATAVCTAS